MKHTLILLTIVFLFSSCEKAILGPDEENTPTNNFDLLWKDFDKRYALFEVKQIDWYGLKTRYRSQIDNNTSESELWDIFTEMLEHLKDGHVSLKSDNDYFESGDSLIKVAQNEFDLDLVESTYLDYHTQTNDLGLSYGKVKDKDIGYIHFENVEGDNDKIFEDVMASLKNHAAIIVDLRNNSGGDDEYAHKIAGAFADGEHFIYSVQTRNGENYGDFDSKKLWYTKPVGNQQYLKPVVLITSRYTVSGAEILTLNMRVFGHITHLGDTTKGDHSDKSSDRFLANGWTYTYSFQKYLMPNGESLEGIGIAPEVYIRNSSADIEAGNDLMFEEALTYLYETYKI